MISPSNTTRPSYPHTERTLFGIDLGGTKIELAVLSASMQALFRKRVPTHAHLGAQHILSQLQQLYSEASALFPNHSIGIGTPGSISAQTGLLRNSNTVCLNGRPIKAEIQAITGCNIVIENDANCFALAEASLGAAKGYDCVFGVIMGTGCGGGWVFQQRLRQGPQHLGGEWGHMVLDPSGLDCFCGHRGCVETFISGSGVERQYQHRLRQQSQSRNSSAKDHKGLSCEEIFEAANLGLDGTAQAVVTTFYESLGQAFANLINIMDPDIIVLGGGLSNMPGLAQLCAASTAKKVFTKEFTTPIVRNQLGDSAGVIGAALLGANDART